MQQAIEEFNYGRRDTAPIHRLTSCLLKSLAPWVAYPQKIQVSPWRALNLMLIHHTLEVSPWGTIALVQNAEDSPKEISSNVYTGWDGFGNG